MQNLETLFNDLRAEFSACSPALTHAERACTGSAPSQTVQDGDVSVPALFELIVRLIDAEKVFAVPQLVNTFLRHLWRELDLLPISDVVCLIVMMRADCRTARFVPMLATTAAFFRDPCFFKYVAPQCINKWLDLAVHRDLWGVWLQNLVDAFGPDETARVVVEYVKSSPRPSSTQHWVGSMVLGVLRHALVACPIIVNYMDLPRVFDSYAPTYSLHAQVKRLWDAKRREMETPEALRVLRSAWKRCGGKPPKRDAEEDAVANLARALCLRRFCRMRGADREDMETELVEPFGRDVVRFL
jgi:hypothetical protein